MRASLVFGLVLSVNVTNCWNDVLFQLGVDSRGLYSPIVGEWYVSRLAGIPVALPSLRRLGHTEIVLAGPSVTTAGIYSPPIPSRVGERRIPLVPCGGRCYICFIVLLRVGWVSTRRAYRFISLDKWVAGACRLWCVVCDAR